MSLSCVIVLMDGLVSLSYVVVLMDGLVSLSSFVVFVLFGGILGMDWCLCLVR